MRRFGLFGAVLLVLAVVYVAAWRVQPSRTSARPSSPPTAAVTAVTRSCPPPAPHAGQAHIALMSMPSGSAAVKSGTGTVALTAVPAVPAAPSTGKQAAAAPPVTVSTPGALVTVTAPAAAGLGGTAVAATGPMAAGFEAEQLDASGTGVVACTHPGSDMWFVGTGTVDGAPQVRLYLMNTGDLPASVNVAILTDAGLQSGLSTGITVAPLVHGSVALALHVQTSSGQVAAAAWESGSSGGAWLPQAAGPATRLVIPGLTVASSAARLFLTVPGSTDARVKVVAFTAQGKFPQFGSVPVDAPASATSSFPLTSLGASAAGLQLTSTVPIVAGVLIPGQGIGSFTTAVAPVTEQGVVAGNPAARGLTVGLVLTAPAATARASIDVIGVGAGSGPATAGGQQVTTVKAGHTLAVTVPRPNGRQPFAVVITPLAGSGPIYAARVVTTGAGGLSARLASLLPVPSALTVITLSPARNSYSAVLP